MKKYLIIASAAILALAGCAKEQPAPKPAEEETVILNFVSERPMLDAAEAPQAGASTRTEWSTDKIIWSSGDKIRVGYTKDGDWMGQSEAGTAKFYKSDAVSIDGGNASVGTFSVPISGSAFTDPAVSGTYQFYAVYPGDAFSETSVADPTAKSITLPTSQTPGSDTFDPTADILVGQSEAMSLSGLPTDPISIDWTRLVAHADLTFSDLDFEGAESVSKITLTFNSEAKVAGSFSVNITDGTAGAGNNNVLTLSGANITSGADYAKAWACVLPVTFTSLSVEVKTDKATYTRDITGISKTFKQNARNILTIGMSTATRTPISELIADGNYVLAVEDSGTYYAISSEQNGTSTRRDRSEITTVGFDPSDYSAGSPYTAANNLIWTITNVSGGVKINLVGDTDSYMQYDSNKLPLGSSGATFEVAEGTGTFTFVNGTSYISMNGTYGFGCYASGTGIHDIYVIPATGTPTITFAETSKNVAADATSVSFTYTTSFVAGDPNVAVTSDTGSAVSSTSISGGTLTVNLNTNTTSSTKTVTLTVSASGASNVVLTITQAGVVGDAENGDVLWAEAFTGFSDNDVPSASNASTTVYGSGSVTYACTDGGSTTKVYGSGNNAGGTAPELLISKSNGAFAVTGIPTGNATEMTLSFKSNNGCTVSSSTTGATFGSNLGTDNSYIYSVTVPSATKTLNITFTNTGSSNTRIDDISVVAGAPVPGITVATNAATATSSAVGTTATVNGTITLVNGAVIGDVDEAGFYYKLTSAGAYTKVTCASVDATSFSYNLTGLTKDSEYTFYAYAIYDGGSEVTGETATFTPTLSGGTKTYTLTISAEDFNTTSYAANNNEKTSNAVAEDSSTTEVKWTSYQVMKSGSNMQWQKSKGYIYNSTDLGTIISVTVNSSAGSFTTYYGTSVQPSSGAAGDNKGFFKTSVGSATGTTTSVVIIFEK